MGIVYLKFILFMAIFKPSINMSKKKEYENYSNETKGGWIRNETLKKSQFVEIRVTQSNVAW